MNSSTKIYQSLILPIEAQIMRSVWRITRNQDDAEDAIQEAAKTIWERLERVRKHANPSALILKICIDSACDQVRRRDRPAHRNSQSLDVDADSEDPNAKDASAKLAVKENQTEIADAIASLPTRQASAVAMRFLAQQSYLEIAAALECRESTARVHVNRGLQKLRRLLAHLDPSPSPVHDDESRKKAKS